MSKCRACPVRYSETNVSTSVVVYDIDPQLYVKLIPLSRRCTSGEPRDSRHTPHRLMSRVRVKLYLKCSIMSVL